MFKIYTPQEWFSIFRCAEIIIEDDGLIYREEDYYKSFRQAIGKIDYSSGYIYGEDYSRLSRIPIGSIKQDGNITKIYGEDYARLTAQPIFYIRDNRIYSADEFFKVFPMETAYVSGSYGGNSTQNKSRGNDSSTKNQEKTENDDEDSLLGKIFDAGFWGIVGCIFALTLVAFACVVPFQILSGQVGAEDGYAALLGSAICIGGLLALMKGEDWFTSVFLTLFGTIIAIFVLDVVKTMGAGNFTTGGFILTLIFGVFLYGLVAIIPSIIVGSIVWFIKRPFVKRKSKKEK